MNKDKVGLFDISDEILKLVLLFLESKNLLYPLMAVNKKLNELASDPSLMTHNFFNQIKVPLRYGGTSFASLSLKERTSILKDVLWASGINEKIPAMAYYTDGGVDGKDSRFFISNIYAEEATELYCSTRGENVHVKTVLTNTLSSHIDLSDINRYRIPKEKYQLYNYPEDTFSYPIQSLLSKYEPFHHKQFAILKYHDLNRNLPDYNAFLQSFVLFISMEEIDVNHPLVRLFDGVKKISQLDKLGLNYIPLQNTEDTQVVEFTLHPLRQLQEALEKNMPGSKLDGVYPFLWGDISKNVVNYLNITQRIGFRFMLLKLIDSHKDGAGTNIDCYSISLSGNIIRLGNAHEE